MINTILNKLKLLLNVILSWFFGPKKDKSSTTINIIVNDKVVGVIQSIDIAEKSGSPNVKVKAERVRFDRAQIAKAFSRGFVHVQSQIYPFDFEVKETDKTTVEVHNAWITSLDASYTSSDTVIVDSMEFEAESVNEKDKSKE